MGTKTKRNKLFWTITILCIVALFVSPILFATGLKIAGACTFEVAIVLWLITIIIHEHR